MICQKTVIFIAVRFVAYIRTWFLTKEEITFMLFLIEVSGQLHVPGVLSPASIGQEAGSALERF
jgi:hypothetical protein